MATVDTKVYYSTPFGDTDDVLATNRSIDLMKDVGIVIEPLSEHPVEILPNP